MNRVIITGATGAIGTALVEEFVRQDVEVLVLTRENSSRNWKLPVHPLVKIKYCALEELSGFQNDSGKTYDVFYHLAWAGASGPGRNDMYLQNTNVRYALDAVALARRFSCHTFIGAGSQAEYGRFEGRLTADTPTFPETGYGYAKLCAGQMTRDYAHECGIRHIWPRILSVYGPNDGAQTMVMSTIRRLLAGETPQFTAGEQLWDYLYSGDAAKAFRAMGEYGVDGKVYVLGSGQARPLRDYIMEIRDLTAPGAALEFGAIPYSERQVMHLEADISALTADTGWMPHTDFKDGIRSVLRQENKVSLYR